MGKEVGPTDWREVTQEDIDTLDRKSTRLNSSHANISYAVFCLKKKIHNLSLITPLFLFLPFRTLLAHKIFPIILIAFVHCILFVYSQYHPICFSPLIPAHLLIS